MCDISLKGLRATIPLEGVSTKVRKLFSRLEDDSESTSWRRQKESKKRREKEAQSERKKKRIKTEM